MGVVRAIENLGQRLVNEPVKFLYYLIQRIISWILSPNPPAPSEELRRPKIAIIGAGITGVSSAAHCVGHGFDVRIFEAGGREALGGIWAKVNNTSGLQIHSIMYRFHPAVKYDTGYPNRKQIVGQVEELWKKYHLEGKTKFGTKVENVYKNEHGQWLINDESNGRFNGVIAAVGTCGDPKMAHLKNEKMYQGSIFHSSDLDGKEKEVEGKNVLVVGGGASAIEALEFAVAAKAKHIYILSRSEKWIIPRNPIIDILLSLNIFGMETSITGIPLGWIPESLLRIFFYRDLKDIAPAPNSGKGLFMETPMVNNDVLEQIRNGKASWLRGDTLHYDQKGIVFNHRAQGVPKEGPGHEELIEGEITIMATGYHRPTLKFLPKDCFEENYQPPNWYLQVFPPKHREVLANNCTYVNAIGTVGNYHIGIYTRFLLMFLVDPLTRPTETWMKRWIDFTRWVKAKAPTGAFDFFTYAELLYWFVFVILVNPFRWKWAPFVLFGVGAGLPRKIVEQEDRLRRD